MIAQQPDVWTLRLQAVGAITAFTTGIIAFGAFGFGIWKYIQDRNRTTFERRLNEVYAPLYRYIAKQEMFRELYLRDKSVREYPILTSKTIHTKTTISLSGDGLSSSSNVEEEMGFLDRNNFIKILTDSNMGLARPKLLVLLSQYELLIHLEENTRRESEEWRKATNKKVEVEYMLIIEILDGYRDSARKLRLNKRSELKDIKISKLGRFD
jgi:hypothetical protein